MIYGLMCGTVFRDITQKTAKNSKSVYVDFTLRSSAGIIAVAPSLMKRCRLWRCNSSTVTQSRAPGALDATLFNGRVCYSMQVEKILRLEVSARTVGMAPKQRRDAVQVGDALPDWVRRAGR